MGLLVSIVALVLCAVAVTDRVCSRQACIRICWTANRTAGAEPPGFAKIVGPGWSCDCRRFDSALTVPKEDGPWR